MTAQTELVLDIQGELPGLARECEQVAKALNAAECSETPEDLAANLTTARDAFEAMRADLVRLEKRAAKLARTARTHPC